MYTHQFLSRARRVLALIPVVVVLLTGTTSALAQVVAPAKIPPMSTVTIVVTGTVPGPPESVAFNKVGVEISSTLSRDPDPTLPPQLIVDITFLKAAGVGLSTKTKFIADYKVTHVRPVRANDVIDITFPFQADKIITSSAMNTQLFTEARAGAATFNLTFDTNGVITGATGSIGANTFAP